MLRKLERGKGKLLSLPVVLVPGESGYVVAEIPLIPGCVSQGQTIEEALANIKEAAELCLEGMAEEDWELPERYEIRYIEIDG